MKKRKNIRRMETYIVKQFENLQITVFHKCIYKFFQGENFIFWPINLQKNQMAG